jgi:spore maturation protein CgeB
MRLQKHRALSSDVEPLKIVIFGLSITSSWGNGHATTFRALVKALAARGHEIVFFERDVPWYASNRDLARPPYCKTVLYRSLDKLKAAHAAAVSDADVVMVGSYVPDGVPLGLWVTQEAGGVTAFYDIDTPVTLSKLRKRDFEYLSPELIPRFDVYFSFTGGPTLVELEQTWKAKRAEPLYCSVDPQLYFPNGTPAAYDVGYLGTYSTDRQPTIERLLIEPARRRPHARFCVAGPQYPPEIRWPANVERIEHLPPAEHRRFYNRQRFTLNVTRDDMIRAGYAPSVRLFEAAACGVPVISDVWPGLETIFEPDREILFAESPDDVNRFLDLPERRRREIGIAARERVLARHTSAHRAAELEQAVMPLLRRVMA